VIGKRSRQWLRIARDGRKRHRLPEIHSLSLSIGRVVKLVEDFLIPSVLMRHLTVQRL